MVEERFKRKRQGGGPNWGAGWDDLFKDQWDNLEEFYQDNFYYRHNSQLIEAITQEIAEVIKQKAIPRMRKYCQVAGDDATEWIRQAEEILGFLRNAKADNEKAIAITAAEQFLRATEPNGQKVSQILNKQDV